MLLSNPCEDDESLCNWVYDQTDSHETANLADWLIGLPLAIIGLVALGLLIRFVLQRLVDRLVARAEGGVLPAGVSRFGRQRRSLEQTHTQELRDLAAATRRAARLVHHAGALILRLPPDHDLLAEVLARIRALPTTS